MTVGPEADWTQIDRLTGITHQHRQAGMTKDTSERIGIENVRSPGRVVRVDATKYNAMKTAMLAVLPLQSPGLTVADVKQRLLPRLPEDLFPGGDRAGWWLKAVQLDLEAKGLIVREDTKPLRLRNCSEISRISEHHDAANATFDDIVAMATAELKPGCHALRSLIQSLDKNCHESVWPKLRIASYGVGPKKMTQHFAYIAVQSGHINLGFYHGAALPDPAPLLEGTGKALRHIKIRNVEAATEPALGKLLRLAILNRRPFADKT